MPRGAALAFAAVLCSCNAATPAAQQGPAASSTPTARASPTPTPSAVRYDEIELFTLELSPVDITVSETEVFVAVIDAGARPSNVRSHVVAAPISGGPASVVVGSEAPAGTGTLGLTYRGDLYVSHASDRTSGVFRLAAGQLVPVAGGSERSVSGGNGDGGPPNVAALQTPTGLAFSSQGDLYVAERGNARVRVLRGNVIETYAGDGTCRTDGPRSGDAKSTSICSPGLVAVDAGGVVYVAQQNGAAWIARIDPTGALTTIGGTFPVGGMAIDTRGNLLALDATNGTVVRFPPAGSASPPAVVASNLGAARGLTVGTDGSIYLVRARSGNSGSGRVWTVVRLRPAL